MSIAAGSALLNGTLLAQSSEPAFPSDDVPSANATRSLSRETVRRLVRQLNATDFDDRRTATRQLMEFGPAILPWLEEALSESEGELRIRGERLRQRLADVQQQQRLVWLVEHPNHPAPQGLPGWDKFFVVAGDSREARELFVQMMRTEPLLLSLIDRDDPNLQAAIELRTTQWQHVATHSGSMPSMTASVAALLMASMHLPNPEMDIDLPRASRPRRSPLLLTRLMKLPPFWQAARAESDEGKILRRLIAAWVTTPRSASAFERMQVGQMFSLPECITPARELLARRTEDRQALQPAIFLLARYGGPEHVPELESWLDDSSELATVTRTDRQIGRPKRVPVRVQDAALLAVVLLTKQEPKTYGFDDVKEHENLGYATSSAAFPVDENREAAHRQWRKWRARNLERLVPFPLDAVEGTSL